MKLIYAIVHDDDKTAVAKRLTKNGFFVTKLATTGGFLMSGNTTFMVCTENEKVNEAIDIIKESSKTRKQVVPSSATFGLGSYTPFPVEVTVGGATIIVTDVERFEKV